MREEVLQKYFSHCARLCRKNALKDYRTLYLVTLGFYSLILISFGTHFVSWEKCNLSVVAILASAIASLQSIV